MAKKGAPVMLLRNISNNLVNGLQGTVYDLTERGPTIEFPSLNMKLPMTKLTFSGKPFFFKTSLH